MAAFLPSSASGDSFAKYRKLKCNDYANESRVVQQKRWRRIGEGRRPRLSGDIEQCQVNYYMLQLNLEFFREEKCI
ncbi:hypothetical protein PUN28_015676 [Cardiocondyla obscurior]|uniref:Uncharacterized protein n=1 Tax=Cardiocondyla obscurior TaxID=286306 RepID=A0AAW2EXU6_9HYME